MQCPICSIKLEVMEREGHVGFCCSKCSGIFLTRKYIFRLNFKVGESAEKFYSALEAGLSRSSDFACPKCKNKMKVSLYKNIELDFCTDCRSVWFDYNELCSTVTFHENTKVGSTTVTKEDVLWGVIDAILGAIW
jgi:Zn-finger nucleic acid-binding protein